MDDKPYFYNPGLEPDQLADWLRAQVLHIQWQIKLAEEKAAIKERLVEIDKILVDQFNLSNLGKQSFAWEPNRYLEALRMNKQNSASQSPQ